LPDQDWKVLRDDLKANPRNRSFGDLDRLLVAAGFSASKGKGSHINYRKPGYPSIVTLVNRKSIPLGYVKAAIRAATESNED
jgi:predicted RNA binding protein YcfA (HicA-like mRNA interferase family)